MFNLHPTPGMHPTLVKRMHPTTGKRISVEISEGVGCKRNAQYNWKEL